MENEKIQVSKEQIAIARRANLYDYLCANHEDGIISEGDSIRLYCNHSVSIKEGYSGFNDFATNETGNAIECLVNYFNYKFTEAVTALYDYMGDMPSDKPDAATRPPVKTDTLAQTAKKQPKQFSLPEPVPLKSKFDSTDTRYRNMFNYLLGTRILPGALVLELVQDGIMYEERGHNNIVFVNPNRSFAEIHGSKTCKSYHQVMFSDPEAFWWFKTDGMHSNADIAFILESAIDAMSLYCIHKISPEWHYNALYCSIAGVANQQRIDRIKAGMADAGLQTILAVDNDNAGEQCRQRNPDCGFAIPAKKDWNEVLIDMYHRNKYHPLKYYDRKYHPELKLNNEK